MSFALTQLAGFGHAPPMASIAFLTSANANSASITIPSTANEGDLAVLLDTVANNTSTIPTSVTPTGFTNVAEVGGSTASPSGGRMITSYKVLTAADPNTSITGMTGNSGSRKVLAIFRPDGYITSVAVGSVNGRITAGNPNSQTITASGGVAPLICLGRIQSFTASPRPSGTLTSSGVSLTVNDSTREAAYYEIQSGTLADRTFDMPDVGGHNAIQSCYLAVK